jgi:hypothetical protein
MSVAKILRPAVKRTHGARDVRKMCSTCLLINCHTMLLIQSPVCIAGDVAAESQRIAALF